VRLAHLVALVAPASRLDRTRATLLARWQINPGPLLVKAVVSLCTRSDGPQKGRVVFIAATASEQSSNIEAASACTALVSSAHHVCFWLAATDVWRGANPLPTRPVVSCLAAEDAAVAGESSEGGCACERLRHTQRAARPQMPCTCTPLPVEAPASATTGSIGDACCCSAPHIAHA
jgi:hypothetical protein